MNTIEPLEGKRCLVTGSAGFVGQALIRALIDKGCPVHGLDVLDDPSPDDGVRWFKGDIRNLEELRRACEGVDTVFHTAAMIELSTRAPASFAALVRSVNEEGTRLLIQAAQEAGVRRFVHTSTMNAVFGQETTGGNETSPYTESKDLYSSTKAAAERIVLDANGEGGLLTCAIRPGGIYGPGERKTIVGPLVESVKQGAPVILFGNGKSVIDYTYVDNLVDAQIRAAERLFEGSDVAGEAYFVTDGTPINPGEFSARLVRYMGVKARTVRIPGAVARTIASALERSFATFGKPKPVITIVHVLLCEHDNYFSIAKAKRDLGYEPIVGTDRGLRNTAAEAREYYDSL